jgi:hypothetical protein
MCLNPLEAKKMSELEIKKLEAEIYERLENTKKTRQEYFWYPAVVGAGLVLAGVTFAKLFL